MPLKDWPPFSTHETYAEWRDRQRRKSHQDYIALAKLLRWGALCVVIGLLLAALAGCAVFDATPQWDAERKGWYNKDDPMLQCVLLSGSACHRWERDSKYSAGAFR